MGKVSAELILRNTNDVENAFSGIIKPEDIRSVTVTAIVDTGAYSLMITMETMQALGLRQTGEKKVHIASGEIISCPVTSDIEINWKNRNVSMQAVAIPGLEHTLMGQLPMEAMDLMVNMREQELVGVHGDEMEFMALAAE